MQLLSAMRCSQPRIASSLLADARSICKGWNSKRYVCLKGDTLQRYTATTGFAGISTDAALPLSKAASVLSRVSRKNLVLSVRGIHDVENESEDIQGNYAILNPSGTADHGRSNTDKNSPKYYYAAEDA